MAIRSHVIQLCLYFYCYIVVVLYHKIRISKWTHASGGQAALLQPNPMNSCSQDYPREWHNMSYVSNWKRREKRKWEKCEEICEILHRLLGLYIGSLCMNYIYTTNSWLITVMWISQTRRNNTVRTAQRTHRMVAGDNVPPKYASNVWHIKLTNNINY